MKRKLNTLELRRLKEGGQQQQNEEIELSPSKKRSTEGGGRGAVPRTTTARNLFLGGTRAREDPREHQNLNREEIALMFMETSEKIDRCFDFDIQKWLDRYETLRRDEETNFPEAAMLVMSASQIYGRKVDYLEDIIMHMGQDQKAREDNDNDGGKQPADKPVGRRRAARFQPQSLSDCFSDLEFSYVDRKTVALGSLVAPVERIGVDRRNKFQQMQELCNELRTMPTKQRRQEILNRLRDEANIPPIMSSHTAARKNQILDLESGETIGTRYDFQIHLNFIDVRTGSLRPEHDLKRFFQRCDVIDYLYEQHEGERLQNDLSPPKPVFSLKPREFKMYLPPEYLRDRYRIELEDTADFDNELHRAKSSNFRKDPIWKLMNGQPPPSHEEPVIEIDNTPEDVSFSNVLSSSRVDNPTELDNTDSEPSSSQETTPEEATELNSSQESTTSNEQSSQPSTEIGDAPEPELMALENQPPSTLLPCDPQQLQQTSQSRLSMDSADEGIGADRESLLGKATPPLSRTCSLDKLSECTPEPPLFFGPGTVIAAASSMPPKTTISLKPALLSLNILKIPECHLRKHLIFALPAEYKKMKMDLVRKSSSKGKDIFTLQLYSLSHRAPKNPEWVRRPSTPDLEDFLGFDEFAEILDGPLGKSLYSLAPPSDGQLSIASRASTPELDFFGFQNDGPETMPLRDPTVPTSVDEGDKYEPPEVSDKPLAPEVEPAVQPGSQQSTPTRTMSRDSGISDDQNGGDRRRSDSIELPPAGSSAQADEPSTPGPLLAPESALNSEKYLQSVTEAKELIEKVNSWHRKLKPILALSEKRNHFDIHAYGTEIIDSFGPEVEQESPQVINFAQVLESKQEDFTARYFLSMLMLANTDNVEIVTRNQDPSRLTQKEDIELRLLSRKRHHQEMESMGERIPCDNTPLGEGKSDRGKKRKRRQLVEEETAEPEPVSGVQRLRVEDGDEIDFLDNIRRMYPDVNGEETMRKRMAFRRGMRRCAYGLSTDERRAEEDDRLAESATAPEENPPPPPPLPIAKEPDPDEVLSVDLLTNEAVIGPCPVSVAVDDDQEPCCSKSLYSTAESGYESMLGGSLL